MSSWTYVRGSITVDVPGRTQPEIEYILKTVIDHLPLVTGSEENMFVNIMKCNGSNSSIGSDEFGQNTDKLEHMFGDRFGWMNLQSLYTIIVHGDLRDREFDETLHEFMKWLTRLSKRICIDDIIVKVNGYKNNLVISDPIPYREMYEYSSWCNKSGEPSWWEYLLWEEAPGSYVPLEHVRKYCKNSNVKEEIERRNAWRRLTE